MQPEISTLELGERLARLVQIPSVNPLQAGPRSGSGGERALAEEIADQAARLGSTVTLDEVEPGRPNVYARFEGATPAVLVVDVHLDTVAVEHMTDDPFDGRIEHDRVYGRGSVDTKPTLAIVLAVLEELLASGQRPAPTVLLVGTVSEEIGGLLGARRFRRWVTEQELTIGRLIVAEPTRCVPVVGHKGGVGLEICVHGHAAHSSTPHLGVNAIAGAARVIAALGEEAARLDAATPTTPVGNGSLAVTQISGGVARNIIPDRCELYAGRRTAPDEDPDRVFEQLAALVRSAAAPLDAEVDMAYGRGSAGFYQPPDSDLVHDLAEWTGTTAETATYGSNALSYPGLANEMVVFGPGSIDQAHQAVEWIELAELERAAAVYRRLLRL